jgi:hypothetical protein
VRQWVLSIPYPSWFLFAARPAIMGQVPGIVYRGIATRLIRTAGFFCKTAQAVGLWLLMKESALARKADLRLS